MRKWQELSDKQSCMTRALHNEMTFVLLGRDTSAPAVIRFWVSERIRIGKNKPGDLQMQEALGCAASMENDYRMIKNIPPRVPAAEVAVNRPALETARMIIASNVYKRRTTLGMLQTELAKASGLQTKTIVSIETGHHSASERSLRKIDEALNKHAGVAKK